MGVCLCSSIFNKSFAELNFPVLAINIYDKETNELILPPYVVKVIVGLKVGLIGIASNIIPIAMPPSFSEGVHNGRITSYEHESI